MLQRLVLILILSSVARAEVVDRVLALVNNQMVAQSDLNSFGRRLNQPGALDELLLGGLSLKELKGNKKAQLNYLINEKLLDSEIQRLHLSVTSARVDQEISQMAKKNGMSKSELISAVKSEGISASDYQDMIKTRIERQSLIENEISSKIHVSDEEILSYFLLKNPSSSSRVYEYGLSHILFNPKKGGPEAAMERGKTVLKKLRSNNESFEALAEQYSEDSNFTNDGALGVFNSTELTPEFQAAVKNLQVGEVSDLVPSRSGLHILKITKKKVVADPEFEKQKEKIRGILYERNFKKAFKEWLDQKRDDSTIRINE